MTEEGRHRPVFVEEVLTLLALRPGGLYVDGTVGDGGHTRLLFERAQPGGRVVGFDRDPQALARATANLSGLAVPVMAVDDEDAIGASPQALANAAIILFHRNYSRISESLDKVIALVQTGADGMERARERVEIWHAKVRRWLAIAAIVFALVAIWIGAGQISPIRKTDRSIGSIHRPACAGVFRN